MARVVCIFCGSFEVKKLWDAEVAMWYYKCQACGNVWYEYPFTVSPSHERTVPVRERRERSTRRTRGGLEYIEPGVIEEIEYMTGFRVPTPPQRWYFCRRCRSWVLAQYWSRHRCRVSTSQSS